MKMELNTIVRLSNDEKFIVLNELDHENRKYYLTMGVIGDKDVDSTKVVILEELLDENGYFIEKVTDSKLLIELTRKFKEQI